MRASVLTQFYCKKIFKILYFKSSVKKRSNQSCCVEELTYPKKAEKSLLIVSGTLCNRSARGIKHELFVKSICRHTYCVTLSLLETAQNAPFDAKGANSKAHCAISKVPLVTAAFFWHSSDSHLLCKTSMK